MKREQKKRRIASSIFSILNNALSPKNAPKNAPLASLGLDRQPTTTYPCKCDLNQEIGLSNHRSSHVRTVKAWGAIWQQPMEWLPKATMRLSILRLIGWRSCIWWSFLVRCFSYHPYIKYTEGQGLLHLEGRNTSPKRHTTFFNAKLTTGV